MTSKSEDDRFALIVLSVEEDCSASKDANLVIYKSALFHSYDGGFCQKLPLALGVAFGVVAQLLGTVGVLTFLEYSSHDSDKPITRDGVRYPVTAEEWDMIVNYFSMVMYALNALFTLCFVIGVITRMPENKESFGRSERALGMIMFSLTVLMAASLGAGLVMFLMTAACIPQILSLGQVCLFLSLETGYVVLIVLLRIHDILVTAIQNSEQCNDHEEGDRITSPLINSVIV